MTLPALVCYEPTKDAGFGHAIRPAAPIKAWSAVEHFLDGCAEVQGPLDVKLVVHRATEWDDESVLQTIAELAVAQFGDPTVTLDGGTTFPEGEPVKGGYHEWRGSDTQWAAFLKFVTHIPPWPKAVIGPVCGHARYRFMWRDPDSLAAIAEQLEGHLTANGRLESELEIAIGRRSFVQPVLWFPFAAGSPQLADLIRTVVVPSVPFKLVARHFRAAVPKRDHSGYRFLRFDANSLLAA